MSPASDRTRRAILSATADALARDRTATLPDIAEAAGVGRTTLHRYFSDRDSLMRGAVEDSFLVLEQAVVDAALDQGSPVEAMRRLVGALVSVGDRLLFLFGDPRVLEAYPPPQPSHSADDAVIGLITRGQADGVFDSTVSPQWIQHVLWAIVYTGHEEVVNGRVPRHGVTTTVIRTFEHGILARQE